MADDIDVTPGSGKTIAADDIGGKLHQRVKLTWGPDGTGNETDVASGKPIPVQLRGSDGTDRSNALPVTGTFWQATQPVSGTFWQATQPVSGTFWQATQPVSIATAPALVASTALIGKVSASHETSTIYNGTTSLTPKFAVIAESSSGDNEVVAAVSGKKIRVLAWDVSPSDEVNFKWCTASTDITGLYYCANAGNGVARAFNPVGYFETVADEALNLNLSGAIPVGGSVVYVEV